MRKFLGWSIFFALFSLGQVQVIWALEQPEKVLTLSDSLKWAMTNNPDLLSLSEKKYIAEQKIKEADSYFYPHISLSGAYTRLDVGTPTTLPPTLGGSSLPVGISNHYAARATVTQALFTGGYLINQRQIAEAGLSATSKEYEEGKREVTLIVSGKFYDVLYLQRLAEIYQEDLTQVKNCLEITKNRSEVKDYEIWLWVVEEAKVANLIEKNQEQLKQIRLAFNKAVGFELNSEIELVGDFSCNTDEEKTLNTFVAQALDRSPTLQRIDIQEDRINHQIGQAFSERYPTVNLGAYYEYSGLNLELPGRNWTATVALQLPLFNGWRSWAKVRQLRGELKQNNLQRVKSGDDLKMSVEHSYGQYKRSGKSLYSSAKNIELAQKAHEAVLNYYKNGKTDSAEVLTVQRQLLETKLLALEDSYDYTLSLIELKVAAGINLVNDLEENK